MGQLVVEIQVWIVLLAFFPRLAKRTDTISRRSPVLSDPSLDS
jgi:hypothetical protein